MKQKQQQQKDSWINRKNSLEARNLIFVDTVANQEVDIIDAIWLEPERPSKPNSQIKIHNISFAGKVIFRSIFLELSYQSFLKFEFYY